MLVAHGARVVITGLDQKTLDDTREVFGSNHLVFKMRRANLKEIDALYAAIKDRFGALDVIFANAGAADSSPMEEVTEQDFGRIFNVNVKGVFFTVEKALPLLRRGASIILTLRSRRVWVEPASLFIRRARQLSARLRVICRPNLRRLAFASMLLAPDQ